MKQAGAVAVLVAAASWAGGSEPGHVIRGTAGDDVLIGNGGPGVDRARVDGDLDDVRGVEALL